MGMEELGKTKLNLSCNLRISLQKSLRTGSSLNTCHPRTCAPLKQGKLCFITFNTIFKSHSSSWLSALYFINYRVTVWISICNSVWDEAPRTSGYFCIINTVKKTNPSLVSAVLFCFEFSSDSSEESMFQRCSYPQCVILINFCK